MNASFQKCIEPLSRIVNHEKGAVIFHQGQRAESIYHVISGEVHLYRHHEDGRRVLLYRAYNDQYFAEASLKSVEYHCTAVSVSPSIIRIINAEKMLAALSQNSEFALAWITHISTELRSQRACVERLHIKSAAERVRHFILTEGAPWGEIHLKGTISELAEMLALSRESLYRTLSKMEQQGELKRTDKILKLLEI